MAISPTSTEWEVIYTEERERVSNFADGTALKAFDTKIRQSILAGGLICDRKIVRLVSDSIIKAAQKRINKREGEKKERRERKKQRRLGGMHR